MGRPTLKDNPVVLFSTPRAGSTWVQEYVSEYNKQFGLKKVVPYEFLNDNFETFTIDGNEQSFKNFDEKNSFLEFNKISFKVHLNQVHDLDWTNSYFKNFYKIILIRKDFWNQFVSYTIQAHNNWNHKREYKNTIIVSHNDVSFFIKLLEKCYNQAVNYDSVLYYEDLSTEFLEKFFNLKCNNKFMLSKNEVINRRNYYSSNIENYDSIKELFYTLLSRSSLIV